MPFTRPLSFNECDFFLFAQTISYFFYVHTICVYGKLRRMVLIIRSRSFTSASLPHDVCFLHSFVNRNILNTVTDVLVKWLREKNSFFFLLGSLCLKRAEGLFNWKINNANLWNSLNIIPWGTKWRRKNACMECVRECVQVLRICALVFLRVNSVIFNVAIFHIVWIAGTRFCTQVRYLYILTTRQ